MVQSLDFRCHLVGTSRAGRQRIHVECHCKLHRWTRTHAMQLPVPAPAEERAQQRVWELRISDSRDAFILTPPTLSLRVFFISPFSSARQRLVSPTPAVGAAALPHARAALTAWPLLPRKCASVSAASCIANNGHEDLPATTTASLFLRFSPALPPCFGSCSYMALTYILP